MPFSEADEILKEYTMIMLPQFPFVPLSSQNAHDLYQLKPLLLQTIISVCRPAEQDAYAAFETWFRQHIAHQTVVLMKKNLELVQAILVFLAWRDIYFYATASDTTLLQIVIGPIGDLGLNGAWRSANPSFRSVVEDATQLRNNLLPQPNQTGDGHRAALGVYYISSILCSILGKRSRLEYTAHFDHCCRELRQGQEHPTDLLLVHLVRIQQIAIKVNDAFHETPEPTSNRPHHSIHSIAVASIRYELEGFMQQLPDHLKSNPLLQTHAAAVRIRLFEPLKHTNVQETFVPSNLRYQNIWECLESCRSLHSAFCQIPTTSYPCLTFASFLHLSLAIIKAMTLLCLEDPAWNAVTARSMYNLQSMLQHVIELCEGASISGSPRSKSLLHGRPIFTEYAEAYRRIERWYSTKVNSGATSLSSTLMDPGIALGSEQFEGFDFWTQLSDLTYGLVP
ncbi:hypothetical protein BDV12DRAFT_199692 [Aspergillus spectabilis]